MPSMKCYQCGKVKRCRMVEEQRDQSVACDDHDACERGPCKRRLVSYLCSPCARELGYTSRSQDGT